MTTDFAVPPFNGLHAGLSSQVLRVYYSVYNELGSGFLESVYHSAMEFALAQAGLSVKTEVPIPVYFRGRAVGRFVADLVVENTLLLELKAVSALDRVHESQVLNYLRATQFEVGLLLNFGPKPTFKRILLTNREKQIRVHPCKSVVNKGAAR